MTYSGGETECRFCGVKLLHPRGSIVVVVVRAIIGTLAVGLMLFIFLHWLGGRVIEENRRAEEERGYQELEPDPITENPKTPIRIGDGVEKVRKRCGTPNDVRTYETAAAYHAVFEYRWEANRLGDGTFRIPEDCIAVIGFTDFKVSSISRY
jgi:hypothetical protein